MSHEQAAIDTLTPAERECFDAVVADIKAHGHEQVAESAWQRLLGARYVPDAPVLRQ